MTDEILLQFEAIRLIAGSLIALAIAVLWLLAIGGQAAMRSPAQSKRPQYAIRPARQWRREANLRARQAFKPGRQRLTGTY